MPQGVEHMLSAEPSQERHFVRSPLMPKGVEHKNSASAENGADCDRSGSLTAVGDRQVFK